MSDAPSKRPSTTQDINELKARLGLATERKRRPSQVGGVVVPPGAEEPVPAPPGAVARESLPPPPGTQEMEAQPAPKAASAVAPEPDFSVDVAGPVANVEKKSAGGRIVKAILVVAALGVGVAVGQISSSARAYNRTIEDAGHILKDVKAISSYLVNLQQALQQAKGRGGATYAPLDPLLLKDLSEMTTVVPNVKVVYQSSLFDLPAEVIEDVLSFYNGTTRLQKDIGVFVERTKDATKVTKEGLGRWSSALNTSFAGIIEMPKGEETTPRIRLVQLGNGLCGNKPCAEGAVADKHQYRLDFDGGWGRKKLATVQGEAVSGDSLIPLSPDTRVFQQAVFGGDATVAQSLYKKRITAIDAQLEELLQLRSRIQDRLSGRAQENKKFSFFM